jgi:hypothetical protein
MTTSPDTASTIRCGDYSAHRPWHRKLLDGSWRCEACRLDPDHAEPTAEQVALAWDLEPAAEQPALDVEPAKGRAAALRLPGHNLGGDQ